MVTCVISNLECISSLILLSISSALSDGMTRCAVNATSVVLIAQMWRSWTPSTPEIWDKYLYTSFVFIPAGTPSNDNLKESMSNHRVLMNITTIITKLTTVSIQYRPVYNMITPAITTHKDTKASAAIWIYAHFTLISLSFHFMKRRAVAALIMIPTNATHATGHQSITCGDCKRCIASNPITPIAMKIITALTNATRIVVLRYQYVYLSLACLRAMKIAINANTRLATSLRLCHASESNANELSRIHATTSMITKSILRMIPITKDLVMVLGSEWSWCEWLCSDIYFNNKIKLFPSLELAYQTGWQYYEQMYAVVSKMDIRTIRSYIDFHITQMWGEINSLQKLSESQKVLYGVTDTVAAKTI